jgi:hypothetical protein
MAEANGLRTNMFFLAVRDLAASAANDQESL